MKKLILGLSLIARFATAQSQIDDFLKAPNFDIRSALQSVGYMFTKKEEGMSFCNLALIGEKHAITNNHCVSSQADCNNTRVYFTADGEKLAGTYKCTRLVKTVDIMQQGKLFSDFSVIELSDTPGMYHGFFPLARGVPSGEFKVWRVKYDPPGVIKANVSINYTRCLGKRELNEKYKEMFLRLKAIHMGETCHIMYGNSGGALLNNDGELVGVINMGDPKEKDVSYNKTFNEWIPNYLGGVLLDTIENEFPQIRDLNR